LLYLARVVLVLALAACSSKSSEPQRTGSAATGGAAATGDRYFELTIDGKPLRIDAADISSTFRTVGNHAELKVFAGKQDAPGISLIAIGPMTGPSSTPNGSLEVESGISQGSVSLQNYPEKGYTTNSFNATYPEMAVVVPDAVVITAIAADGADAKLVTGTFDAKTYGSHSKGTPDPKDTDHVVKGKFRIRHEFTSMSGDRF
jgi:hypothetical protein